MVNYANIYTVTLIFPRRLLMALRAGARYSLDDVCLSITAGWPTFDGIKVGASGWPISGVLQAALGQSAPLRGPLRLHDAGAAPIADSCELNCAHPASSVQQYLSICTRDEHESVWNRCGAGIR